MNIFRGLRDNWPTSYQEAEPQSFELIFGQKKAREPEVAG